MKLPSCPAISERTNGARLRVTAKSAAARFRAVTARKKEPCTSKLRQGSFNHKDETLFFDADYRNKTVVVEVGTIYSVIVIATFCFVVPCVGTVNDFDY